WETLEGLAKHNGPPALSGEQHDRRLLHAVRDFEQQMDLQLDCFASGEAQAAALADDIAWHTHDIDDGLRAGLLVRGDLREVPLVRNIMRDLPEASDNEASRDVHEIVRRLIAQLIADVVCQSRRRFSALAPQHPDEIRNAGVALVAFSEDMQSSLGILRDFLFARLYHHPAVMKVMQGAEQVVQDLVRAYADNECELPSAWQSDIAQLDGRKRMRRIADFVAGMTDRFAIAEHQRLFDVTPQLG
ncbi:MAG: deoxyguanosinetriphosphate triphosphohydrolase, partial [Hyphomicrobiaceae bacterium]